MKLFPILPSHVTTSACTLDPSHQDRIHLSNKSSASEHGWEFVCREVRGNPCTTLLVHLYAELPSQTLVIDFT